MIYSLDQLPSTTQSSSWRRTYKRIQRIFHSRISYILGTPRFQDRWSCIFHQWVWTHHSKHHTSHTQCWSSSTGREPGSRFHSSWNRSQPNIPSRLHPQFFYNLHSCLKAEGGLGPKYLNSRYRQRRERSLREWRWVKVVWNSFQIDYKINGKDLIFLLIELFERTFGVNFFDESWLIMNSSISNQSILVCLNAFVCLFWVRPENSIWIGKTSLLEINIDDNDLNLRMFKQRIEVCNRWYWRTQIHIQIRQISLLQTLLTL